MRDNREADMSRVRHLVMDIEQVRNELIGAREIDETHRTLCGIPRSQWTFKDVYFTNWRRGIKHVDLNALCDLCVVIHKLCRQ